MNQALKIRKAQMFGLVACAGLGLAIASCDEVITNDYEAMAITTYAWRAEYTPQRVTQDRPREGRVEIFETNSLVNTNGEPTVEATGDRDENGIWWPALPPKPTVEELEARQQDGEVFSEPLIDKTVEYSLTFQKSGERVTLPTNYSVYRQAVRAYGRDRSLKLLLGVQDTYVQKAEIE